MFSSLFSTAEGFLAQPFRQNMNAARWIALVVFTVTIAILWVHVLRHFEEV